MTVPWGAAPQSSLSQHRDVLKDLVDRLFGDSQELEDTVLLPLRLVTSHILQFHDEMLNLACLCQIISLRVVHQWGNVCGTSLCCGVPDPHFTRRVSRHCLETVYSLCHPHCHALTKMYGCVSDDHRCL